MIFRIARGAAPLHAYVAQAALLVIWAVCQNEK
jgi:hypothetical protein